MVVEETEEVEEDFNENDDEEKALVDGKKNEEEVENENERQDEESNNNVSINTNTQSTLVNNSDSTTNWKEERWHQPKDGCSLKKSGSNASTISGHSNTSKVSKVLSNLEMNIDNLFNDNDKSEDIQPNENDEPDEKHLETDKTDADWSNFITTLICTEFEILQIENFKFKM